MRGEELFKMPGYGFIAALIEHQHGRAGAAERAPEQTRLPQLQHLAEPGDQRSAIGLMQTVLQRSRE